MDGDSRVESGTTVIRTDACTPGRRGVIKGTVVAGEAPGPGVVGGSRFWRTTAAWAASPPPPGMIAIHCTSWATR